jgi:hypothetical protein
LFGIEGGTYSVVVTDENGCSDSSHFIINEFIPCDPPSGITKSISGTSFTITWDMDTNALVTQVQYRVKLNQPGALPDQGTAIVSATSQTFTINSANCGYYYEARLRHACSADLQYRSTWKFVPVIPMNCPKLEGLEEPLGIYPNPTNESLNVEYRCGQTGQLHITVTDVIGTVIYRDDWVCSEGMNKFAIDVSTYDAGVYVLEVKDQKTNQGKRFVVVR